MATVVKATSKEFWTINLKLHIKLEKWVNSFGPLVVQEKILGTESKEKHLNRYLNLKAKF